MDKIGWSREDFDKEEEYRDKLDLEEAAREWAEFIRESEDV